MFIIVAFNLSLQSKIEWIINESHKEKPLSLFFSYTRLHELSVTKTFMSRNESKKALSTYLFYRSSFRTLFNLPCTIPFYYQSQTAHTLHVASKPCIACLVFNLYLFIVMVTQQTVGAVKKKYRNTNVWLSVHLSNPLSKIGVLIPVIGTCSFILFSTCMWYLLLTVAALWAQS